MSFRRAKRSFCFPKCPDLLWSRPTFYSIATVVLSHGLSGRWPPTSIYAEVKNGWSCTSTPSVCLRGVDRTTLYRKCQGSMKIRPTARTSLSKKSHRSDSTPGPQVTSRRPPSHTGFRRQQGVKRNVFFASPPYLNEGSAFPCSTRHFVRRHDLQPGKALTSVSKFVDTGEVSPPMTVTM